MSWPAVASTSLSKNAGFIQVGDVNTYPILSILLLYYHTICQPIGILYLLDHPVLLEFVYFFIYNQDLTWNKSSPLLLD